ncbi:hypothetical protein [Psychromonas sp. MME2]|uniref:hypothetical protein n=1 Tax=unclassified Psychromonas TaxID=2614957 RepID=UPI00339C8C53
MKKILLLVALIAVGYYIYSDYLSPPDKDTTLSEKDLRAKKLFDKLSSTPVSAQEVKPVFKDSMISNCKLNGANTENGFGTTAECINNFETLASDRCFGQLADFEGKVYASKRALMADFLVFNSCASAIVRDAAL